MLVESPEALKQWLTDYLEPICDADPAALSKYVIALIKKDKPQTELKTSMENQMEVFLQAETEGFITALFGIIETKEYVNMPPKKAPKKEDAEAEAEAEASIKPDPDAVPAPQEDKSASQVADSTTPTRVEAVDESEEAAAARSRNDRNYHSRRYPSRRSRSPPANGTRRFSGGRRSPPRGPRYHRTSRSRSPPPGFRRSRSRSPYGRGRRRRSPRSYTPPPPPHRRADSRGSTPTKDEEGANPYLASTVTVAASSAVAVAAPAEKRPRCRDYDEKGFCMRGDQCKFDHGNDAVVLEESVPPYTPAAVFPAVVPAVPEAYVPSGLLPPLPPLHVPPPGYAVHAVVPAAIENSRKRRYEDEAGATAYPSKAGVFDRVGGYGGRGGFRGRGRGRGRGGRGGNAGGGPTQLAVRNIPTQVNNIAHLNNHFARYGTLVNVQVQFEGDPASALVTFSNTEEATSAFNSAEAVLGNRFIKMFYHYSRHPQSVKDRLGGGGGGGGGGGPQDQDEKPKTEEEEKEEKEKKEEEKAAAIAAIKKNQDMLEATSQLIKEADVKRMESVKKSSEIAKSKQDLLEKYIEEQKRIITLMEERKATIKPEEKSAMMGMLKMLTQKIEVAKEEVKQNITVRPKAPSELQKDLLDAELELMQAKNDGSENVGEMQKRVNQLRFEAAKMGYPPTSRGGGISRGRGRGYAPRGYAPRGMYGRGSPRGSFFRGGRGRGGRGFHAMTTVDRRPSKIAVMGFEEGEKDEVVAHFQKFGEVVESMEDEASGAIVVHFKTRRFAEVAMGGGQQFGAKELQLAWFTSTSVDDSSVGGHNVSGGEGDVSGGASLAGDDDLSGGVDGDLIDDGYVAPNMSYVPEGLDDHEVGAASASAQEEDLLKGDDAAGDDSFEGNADALLEEEEEEEEEEDGEERSWKR